MFVFWSHWLPVDIWLARWLEDANEEEGEGLSSKDNMFRAVVYIALSLSQVDLQTRKCVFVASDRFPFLNLALFWCSPISFSRVVWFCSFPDNPPLPPTPLLFLFLVVLFSPHQLVLINAVSCCNAFGCMTAGRRLHFDAIKNVMGARMSWFESTPSGRILSRFSGDLSNVDLNLQVRSVRFLCFALAASCSLSLSLLSLRQRKTMVFFSFLCHSPFVSAARRCSSTPRLFRSVFFLSVPQFSNWLNALSFCVSNGSNQDLTLAFEMPAFKPQTDGLFFLFLSSIFEQTPVRGGRLHTLHSVHLCDTRSDLLCYPRACGSSSLRRFLVRCAGNKQKYVLCIFYCY